MVQNSFEFLDLAAAVTPSVQPRPNFSDADKSFTNDDKVGSSDLLSNVQFMVLGAILGVLATIIYYQVARFCQQYRQQSRSMRIQDIENSNTTCSSEQLEDPNKYLFKKVFKEDKQ